MATTKKAPQRRTSVKKADKPLSKVELAKKKVDELLGEVSLSKLKNAEKDIVVDKLEEATKDKGVDFLKKQVEGLTEENTKLNSDYAKLFNDYQQIKQSGGVPTGGEATLKRGIEQIFFELDGVLTGEKFGKPYPEAKIRPLLNKFMAIFPFLGESLKKKKTITQKPRR